MTPTATEKSARETEAESYARCIADCDADKTCTEAACWESAQRDGARERERLTKAEAV